MTSRVKPPFRPLDDRVLIKPDPKSCFSLSGNIAITQQSADKQRPEKGVVLAVGEGRFDNYGNRIPMAIQQGDVIAFPKSAGKELVIEEKKGGKTEKVTYLLIHERDIYGTYT